MSTNRLNNRKIQEINQKITILPSFFIGLVLSGAIIFSVNAQTNNKEKCKKNQGVLEELQFVERDLAVKNSLYTSDHPEIKELKGKKDRLVKILEKNAKDCQVYQ